MIIIIPIIIMIIILFVMIIYPSSSSLVVDLFPHDTKQKFNQLLYAFGRDELFNKLKPHLLNYQGECPGMKATGNLPPHYCGKSLTVENPLQRMGQRKDNEGSGFIGLQVCKDCMEDISKHKFRYHELSILRSKPNLTPAQDERLEDIQPAYKAIHIHQLNGYYCTENEVVVKTNQLDNISLEQCPLKSLVPKILNN